MMQRVPVVFNIDRNVVTPFMVCVTSLLEHAGTDTFYELFVLCNLAELDGDMQGELRRVVPDPGRASLTFVDVRGAFANAFEIRNITIAAYYRLLIPDLFPSYDRMIYADVDMIFRTDLSDLYSRACARGELLAGVREWNDFVHDESSVQIKNYLTSIGSDSQSYINSGFLVLNLEAMRREGVVSRFLALADRQYICQDQDIINIVCRGRIELLPMRWNYTYSHYIWAYGGSEGYRNAYRTELEEAERVGTIHYSGPKPWKEFCPRYDYWWSCYRRSAAFDPEVCFRADEAICSALARLQNLTQARSRKPSAWKRFRRRLCRAVGFKKSYWE